MDYPKIRKQQDITENLDFDEGGVRIRTTLWIADGILADVITVQSKDKSRIELCYVEDGDSTYRKYDGSDNGKFIQDYGFEERMLTDFAESNLIHTPDGSIAPKSDVAYNSDGSIDTTV